MAMRSATEFKKPKKQFRFWRCDDCGNIFATTFRYNDEHTDGETPQCCPYCGVLFNGFTELP